MTIHFTLTSVSSSRLARIAFGSVALMLFVTAFALSQTVTVNWSAPSIGNTTPQMFGSNDQYCGQFAQGALDPAYASDMSTLGIRFLRLHGDTVDDWTTNGKWDQTKVATELSAPYVKACKGANLIITINYVPSWCRNTDGSINDAEYAAFCAQLVKITNKRLGKHVLYWECMNEPDGWSDFANGNWSPMFALYNQCATAMKALDPTIKVGGPTMSWYNNSLADQFLTNCWSNVDFLSWHTYLTGVSCNPPLDGPTIYSQIMQNIPSAFDTCVADANGTIAYHRSHGYTDGHPILLDLDEFSICWNWNATGWGQDSYVGATFFGSVLTHLADDQINMSANWSAKDGYYGLIDMSDNIRLPGDLYQLANHHLIGSIADSTSDDPDIECLPIYRGATAIGQKHAFLLVNQYYGAKSVTLFHGLPTKQTAKIYNIDSTGLHTSTLPINAANALFTMPGFSVTLVTLP